ncbi:MAG: triose-phosphate isomerase [Candidatus Nanopelagicales bacterium]|jgi:triosephosphate isomerase
MRKPLIAGNWKMNLNHLEAIAHVQRLAFSLKDADFDEVDIAVFPPFTDIRSVQTLVDADKLRIGYGGQDCGVADTGAFTGQISASFLAKLGCKYVIVGHSERRQINLESSEMVSAKAKSALKHKLIPIVCVGEGIEQRKNREHIRFTLEQLENSLLGLSKSEINDLVIAYEPVWAIGTGEVATPDDAEEMSVAIRTWLADNYGDAVAGKVRILYGGSVKSGTAPGLMAMPNVDGLLVGGASIDPDEFVAICRYRLAVG